MDKFKVVKTELFDSALKSLTLYGKEIEDYLEELKTCNADQDIIDGVTENCDTIYAILGAFHYAADLTDTALAQIIEPTSRKNSTNLN